MKMDDRMTDSIDFLNERLDERDFIEFLYKIPIKQLVMGTFETESAALIIYHNFLVVSFNDKAGATVEFQLDPASITKIKQQYEAEHDKLINFTLRPRKVQELAMNIPGGFIFSCTAKDRYSRRFSSRFLIRLPDDLDPTIAAHLMNMLSSVTPDCTENEPSEAGGGEGGGGGDEGEEESNATDFDVNSRTICKKMRQEESKTEQFERSFLQTTFDDDDVDVVLPPDTSNVFEEQEMKPVRNTRSRLRAAKNLLNVDERDYYASDDIPEQLRQDELEASEKEAPQVKKEAAIARFDEYNNAETLMVYPPLSENLITMENYKCLDRRELIDNVILDFYMQYIYRELMTEEMRQRVHICSSSFYSLYSTQANFAGWKNDENKTRNATEKRYLRVANLPCIKDVNIFEKDFIVFPCHDRDHWFLAIACYPQLNGAVTVKDCTPVEGEDTMFDPKNPNAGEPIIRSCILTFDSVKANPGRRTKAMIHIRNFLLEEYNAKYQNDFAFVKNATFAHSTQCPQQSNATDCGLYLLEFVERFFVTAPIVDFRSPIDLSGWFEAEIILKKREHIAQVIQALIIEQKGALPDLPPISFIKRERQIQAMEGIKSEENNGNEDNNNEEVFNNNNDFNAVDHNKLNQTQNAESLQKSSLGDEVIEPSQQLPAAASVSDVIEIDSD